MICGSSWRTEPGGGVAGVGVRALAALLTLPVQFFELVDGKKDLTAHLKAGGYVFSADTEGNAADGAEIGGNVLAFNAGAACRAADQQAVLIGQRDGQAVVFQFAVVVDGLAGDEVHGAALPCFKLLVGKDVAEAEERHGMADGLKSLGRFAGDTLRGGVRCYEGGVEFSSRRRSSRRRPSYSPSEISGLSRT